MKTLLKNGRLIDPASKTDALHDILIDNGMVAAIEKAKSIKMEKGTEVIDCAGLVVSPGFIDLHVHLREPGQTHKETIRTGTMAAAAGGFTTVCAMPNTTPVNDSTEITEWMQHADRGASVHVLPVPSATVCSMGEKLTDYAALKRAGAVAVSDDGKPILGDSIMRAALVLAAKNNLPVSQHAEDTRLTGGCSMHAGDVSFRLGLRGMTVEAESSIVERDIRLCEEIERKEKLRPHLHVQHVSTERALDAIRAAKKRGLHLTCEVAPHHFALTDEAIAESGAGHNTQGAYDSRFKMNPPLRTESDRQACIAGLLDGTVDCIATDHAPHAHHEKNVEFERAPNGITGLETALGLALRILHMQHGMSLMDTLRLLTSGPSQVFSLAGTGRCAIGQAADLTLFEPATVYPYNANTSFSKSRNTPFHDIAMQGRIRRTLVRGKSVFNM
ncbi:MAG: dihydroorotase [Acidobacteria bacterium]|nr:dihydroorotase [Acidobacteriota bacterium]